MGQVDFFDLCQTWVELWASESIHRSACQVLLALYKTRTIGVQSAELLFTATRDMFLQLKHIASEDENRELQMLISEHLFFQAQSYAEALGLKSMADERDNHAEKKLLSLIAEDEAYTSPNGLSTVSGKDVPIRGRSQMVVKDDPVRAPADIYTEPRSLASFGSISMTGKSSVTITEQSSGPELELADSNADPLKQPDEYIHISNAKLPTIIQRQSADVSIYGQSNIDLNRNAGSCSIQNQQGDVDIHRTAGDISVFDVAGHTSISKTTGDCSIFHNDGALSISSSNGPCSIVDN